MKKTKLLLLSILGLFLIVSIIAYGEIRSGVIGPVLSMPDAQKQFGDMKFDEAKFKASPTSERAKMAADLIRKKTFIGASYATVKEKLGDYTGYFWNDAIPTYILNEGSDKDEDVWQLVFLPGHNGKVSEVIINKNCCSKR